LKQKKSTPAEINKVDIILLNIRALKNISIWSLVKQERTKAQKRFMGRLSTNRSGNLVIKVRQHQAKRSKK
jgi:hypothetical protein